MKKKGIFYCRIHRNDPVNLGAVKKCNGVVDAFRKLGHETDIVWYGSEGVILNDEVIFRFKFSDHSGALKNILFHHLLFDSVIAGQLDFRRYDFLFVRYPLSHPGFIRFLKKARSVNPALSIFLEVPTYPYDKEMAGLLRKFQYRLDRLCNPFLKKYVDWTVHYGAFESIFGIPSIPIGNGIDLEQIPVSHAIRKPGSLRLIAVGNWNHWHGLDRLIEGMRNYYRQPVKPVKVELTIVGGGREIPAYRQMVEMYGLTSSIRFLPPLEGKALDTLFDEADVAIGSLGLFRLNLSTASPLKHREYCARGLPMVLCTKDETFPDALE